MAAKSPDVIEWRVDYFEGIGDTAAVLETGRALRAAVGDAPVIFTRRSIKEGGEPIGIGDADVVRLYDAVGASRLVDFIDFEMGNDPEHVRAVRESTRAHGTRLILSYHNFGYTPGAEFLVQRFLEAERLGADVAKVAVMPRDRARRVDAARGDGSSRRQGAHSADQHVDGAARRRDADDRRGVRLVAVVRRRRRQFGTRTDADRRPQSGL